MIDTYTAFGLVLFTLAILAAVAVAVRIGIAALERGHVPADDAAERVITPVYANGRPNLFVAHQNHVMCNEHGMFRLNEAGEWVPFEGSN